MPKFPNHCGHSQESFLTTLKVYFSDQQWSEYDAYQVDNNKFCLHSGNHKNDYLRRSMNAVVSHANSGYPISRTLMEWLCDNGTFTWKGE